MKKYYLPIAFLVASFAYSQCYSRLTSAAQHVTGLKTDGTLWGWGENGSGSLDLISSSTPAYEQFPVLMGLMSDIWVYNKNGRFNSFAIKNNGTLWATGSNFNGILGIGTTTAPFALTQVGTASNYVAVDSYDEHSLALRSDGTIWTWGRNDFNQLGQGISGADVLSPIQVGAATDWSKIAVTGSGGSIALKTNGTLWCWGFNCGGSLAGGTTITTRPSPFQIGTATDWFFVEPGNCHVLALKTDNTLWAWGNRTSGQLGIPGITALQSQSPTQIGTTTWQSIAAGRNTSFGVQTNGTLWVWGENINGELGLNDTTNRNAPTQIGTDTNWVSIIAGEDHTIAIKSDGTLWGWGRNRKGAAGTGSFDSSTGFFTPVLVPTLIPNMCATLQNESFSLATTVSISPNPAKEQVNIVFSTALQNPNISIVDVTGKTVLTQNNTSLLNNTSMNVAGLSKGLYLVVVKSEGIVRVEKLVVD
ncbi:MAG: T9SS type A sorting domain-containing protein [Crocinitomicaceae bacterium]|nr:T9SS type A sorting domain-containing protein [Crocinitomicaceae bacterium]